jgi:dephospho-CoA kinase
VAGFSSRFAAGFGAVGFFFFWVLMKRFCITGGIACGKSVVASRLAAGGWLVVDADGVARELLEPGAAGYEKTVDAFGKSVLNGGRFIDRMFLGRVVFADAGKRKVLNSILHPLVYSVIEERLSGFERGCPGVPVVAVVPLLFEAGWEGGFDSVVCVASPLACQLARLGGRGLGVEEALQRVRCQWPVEEKVRRCGVVLWNGGSLVLLGEQVELLRRLWLGL